MSSLNHPSFLTHAFANCFSCRVVGGVGYTPAFLKKQVAKLKSHLNDPNAPFGVDLLLPKVGGYQKSLFHGLRALTLVSRRCKKDKL